MTATGYHRGHAMSYTDGAWRYADMAGLVSDDPDPACGQCGRRSTPEGHDGCLGTLPGVRAACCGHGHKEEAYVSLVAGRRLSGREAIAWIERSTTHE